MNIQDFDIYKDLLYKESGLFLTPEKSYLLESRLAPVARRWNYPALDNMTQALRGVPDRKLVKDVVDAMTTNETFFFRDNKPFDLLRDKILPEMIQSRAATRRLRIWSAACSSGQEPYSIAMLLKEKGAALSGWNISILATDLSEEILTRAREGLYTQFEVQRGLPVQLLVKYFTQEAQGWRISNEIKSMVTYQAFNLLSPMSGLGTFDIIFCRNVLIYFDAETKGRVLANMSRQLAPDGPLFLGGAETVLGITDKFMPSPGYSGLYRLAGSENSASSSVASPNRL